MLGKTIQNYTPKITGEPGPLKKWNMRPKVSENL